jgi:hypothetical protein
MAVHAHAIRARAASVRRLEHEQNTLARSTVDLLLDGNDRARQTRLNQFLCELASPELVRFMQERQRKLKLRH